MRAFRFRSILLLPCAAFLVLRHGGLQAQWPGEVAGRVVDALHRGGVEGATVRSSVSTLEVVTDASGAFRLRGLEPGSHELIVERPGYVRARVGVDAVTGSTRSVLVELEPAVPVTGIDVTVTREAAGAYVVALEGGPAGRTAADLLRGVPGVVVVRQGPGGRETVSVRGGAPDGVLVLLDGVPLNDPVTGEADLSTVPPDVLSRVVVLLGARSAEYGPRAQSGVILLETLGRLPRAGARVGGGSLGRRDASAEASAAGSALLAGGAVGVARARNDFAFRLPPETGGGEARRTNADQGRAHARAHLDGALLGGVLRVRGGASRLDRGLPGRSYAPSPAARQEELRVDAVASWSGGRRVHGRAQAHVASARVRHSDPMPPFGLPYDETTEVWEEGLGIGVRTASGPLFLEEGALGLELRRVTVRSGALSEGARAARVEAGAYASGSVALASGPGSPSLKVAGRLHRIPGGRLAATHEALLGGTMGPLSWHAAHRSAYTPPTLGDQYFREGIGVRANPSLEAERVPREVEAGLAAGGRVGGTDLLASLTAWAGDVRGMIVWSPDFRFVWSPRNVDVRRRGLEGRAEARLRPPGAGTLSLAGHYALAHTTWAAAPGVQVLYRPRHAGGAAATWSGPRLEASVEARYTGWREPVPARVNTLPGFWSWNAAVSRSMGLLGWTATPSIRVERLEGRGSSLVFAFPEPGRTAHLSIDLRKGRP